MTPRESASAWAEEARSVRYETRRSLRSGEVDLAHVLSQANDDDLIGRIKLLWVLESLPEAGKVLTRRKLAELGLEEERPLSDLDEATRRRLLEEFPYSPVDKIARKEI